MSFFTAIRQFFATIFSPLRHPGSNSGSAAKDEFAVVDARARRKAITVVIAVLVIIGSGVRLYYKMMPAEPKINQSPFIGLGQVLAEETAQAIGVGRVAIVIAQYHTQSGTPMNSELEAFRSTLKQHGGIEIAATDIISPEDLGPAGNLPSKKFNDLINQGSQFKAVVSFVGLPALDDPQPLQLPSPHPVIIALLSDPMSSKQYFIRQIANVLILPRTTPTADGTATPTTPRGWFDKYFEVYTPANYQSLPN